MGISIFTFSVKPIRFDDLFSGVLEGCGIREWLGENPSKRYRCLTDGSEQLWAYGEPGGLLDCFDWDPAGRIFRVVEEIFETDLYTIPCGCDWDESESWSFQSWLDKFTERACHLSQPLCAEILSLCWQQPDGAWGTPSQTESVNLREELAGYIAAYCFWEDEPRPRSLQDTERYIVKVSTSSSQFVPRFPLDWNPRVTAGKPVWVGRIGDETGKDEFLVSWMDTNGQARRALEEWALAADERFLNRHRHLNMKLRPPVNRRNTDKRRR